MTAQKKVSKMFAAALTCGPLVMAVNRPAFAGDGPLNTPLSTFTDTKPAKHVWTVPGVVKRNSFSTNFSCTSLEAPGTLVDIGVEVFKEDGTQLNSIDGSIPVTGSACPTGAVLAVPAGSTRTIGLTGTAQMHEDCKIGVAAFLNGSARIVSTSAKIACNAVVIDDKHTVQDPLACASCPPPSAFGLKVIRSKKQSGD